MLLPLLLACGGSPAEPDDQGDDQGDDTTADSGDDTAADSGADGSGSDSAGETAASGETGDSGCEEPSTWFADADGDGHGAPGTGSEGCGGPGWSAVDDDCDDADGTTYPGAPELCDGHDNHCDGAWSAADEDGLVTFLDSAGHPEDRTAEWSGTAGSPARPALDAGTWRICPGTFYVSATTTGAVVLEGSGQDVTTLSGGGGARILSTTDALGVSGVTLRDGSATGAGGAILQTGGELLIEDTVFSDNAARGEGGGLRVESADGSGVTLRRVTFSANTGLSGGGAAIAVTGAVRVEACAFDHNAGSGAGGLSVDGATLAVADSTFTENQATSMGGGLLVYSSTIGDVTVEDCLFEGNTGGYGGGAYILCDAYVGDTLAVRRTTFLGNSADDDGGGAWLGGDTVEVSDSVVEDNGALTAGGLHVGGFDLAVATTTFTTNVASQEGGGLYLAAFDAAILDAPTFTGNEAAYGGGLYLSLVSRSAPTGFFTNTASMGGGAFFDPDHADTLTARACDFGEGADDNVADDGIDLYVVDVGEFSYGDAATFTCTDTECR